jgi:uncharacterized small protein (DUF1192 family)
MSVHVLDHGHERREALDRVQERIAALSAELAELERAHLPADEILDKARHALEAYRQQHPGRSTLAWLRQPGVSEPLLRNSTGANVDGHLVRLGGTVLGLEAGLAELRAAVTRLEAEVARR